jgi:hypothetical protein
MTETRDFDRRARAWLDLMPNEAPDRVIDAVLQAVDATPQRRRMFDPAVRRFFPMNRLSYAAIAVAIAVLGGGALLLTQFRPSNVGATQTPTPTASTSPSPTGPNGSALPAALQGVWFGGSRDLAGLQSGAGTFLRLDAATFGVAQANQQDSVLLGGAASIVDGQIEVQRGTARGPSCPNGIGRYAYSLSVSRQTLTISPGLDACAPQDAALEGIWWKIDCHGGQDICLGHMDAGQYRSQYFRPILHGAGWAPKFGGLTFAVPDGWASDADWPSTFGLELGADYDLPQQASGAPRLTVLGQVDAAAQGAARCGNTPAAGVGRTAGAVVSYLRSIPGLVVGKSHQLTIDGHDAIWVDLSVNAATVKPCPGSGEKIVGFLVSGGEGYAIGTPGVQRVILVGAAPDELVAISLEARDQATQETFYAQALPIIQSFHFE